jgi:hypothetical protein
VLYDTTRNNINGETKSWLRSLGQPTVNGSLILIPVDYKLLDRQQ